MIQQLGTQTIETDRLILRRFTRNDVTSVWHHWASDEELQLLYGEPVYKTFQEVENLIQEYIHHYQSLSYYRWAIISKENQECIGQIAYFFVDEKNHFAEIEYCIGRKFQCLGYVTEATLAVINYGFMNINLHKIQISHKSSNTPSQKVIKKCGFIYEGTLRDYFYEDNHYIDRLFYSLLKEEYLAKK